MLQSLVVSLREGVEAALIVGIVLGYLRKTGRESASRFVYWGILGAAAASLAAAYFVRRLQVSEDAYEGWLMLIGSLFVASMVVWMWRTGKRMKQDIEDRLSKLASGGARWGIFLFVFLMVFREGIETVLFLAAVSLRTTELANLLGACAGLALAIALGTAFFKGSLRVNLRKFFSVTTLVLLVVAVQLFIAGVHELSESGVLPSSSREMSLVGPLVNNDVFFFVVIIAVRFPTGRAARQCQSSLPPGTGNTARSREAQVDRSREAQPLLEDDDRRCRLGEHSADERPIRVLARGTGGVAA
jgi:high-affinity iron transporter